MCDSAQELREQYGSAQIELGKLMGYMLSLSATLPDIHPLAMRFCELEERELFDTCDGAVELRVTQDQYTYLVEEIQAKVDRYHENRDIFLNAMKTAAEAVSAYMTALHDVMGENPSNVIERIVAQAREERPGRDPMCEACDRPDCEFFEEDDDELFEDGAESDSMTADLDEDE